jgi:endoglycosylceramidase
LFSKIFIHLFFENRSRIFHGVNAVYKIAPWHPTVAGFDSENTLSEIDSANLKKWGFNVVRLGVMWPGVEPTARGLYNQTYLDQIETIVTNLGKSDIYVILDFHQDIWHRKYCGEGVPDYVFDTCQKAQPANTQPFPLPAVNITYPLDIDGNPTIESCLSSMFATYYMSAEVGAGFQCLYDNEDNLWDAFAGYWVAVAQRFSRTTNVLGYELINEPWAGDVFAYPKNLFPGYAEKTYLQPLYEHLHKAIRAVDDSKIIFFEGLTIDYWQSGFSAGPGGVEYNDRQALAYHIYCPLQDPSGKKEVVCDVINDALLAFRRKDAERMGVAMLMTEFGAAEDIKADIFALEETARLADRFQQSWMYWQFKYYEDLTTCTPLGESLYDAAGEVCLDKLQVLSRTYPQAVAGTLHSFHFDVHTAAFTMEYSPLAVVSEIEGEKDVLGRTSEVYFNRELFYPHGVRVVLEGNASSVISVKCPSVRSGDSVLQLVQTASLPSDDAIVSVSITKCHSALDAACTCK